MASSLRPDEDHSSQEKNVIVGLLHCASVGFPIDLVSYNSDSSRLVAFGDDYDRSVVRVWDTTSGESELSGAILDWSTPAFFESVFPCFHPSWNRSLLFRKQQAEFVHKLQWYDTDESQNSKLTTLYLEGTRRIIHGDFSLRDIGRWNVISHDGTLLASSVDHTVTVWNLVSGRLLHTLYGHDRSVRSAISFHPNHAFELATGSHDATIRIWNIATGTLIQILEGHLDEIYAVAYSPHGRYLASASFDETVRIWAFPESKLQWTLRGHARAVSCLAWSPDGQWIVSGSHDGTLRIWNADEGGPAYVVLETTTSWIRAVDWSIPRISNDDNMMIVSGSDDGTIRIWEVYYEKRIQISDILQDRKHVIK